MNCMDATDINIAQLTVTLMISRVIMENVNLKAMSVTSTMTVEITVMKWDVVCCKKKNHDIFSAQVKSSYECMNVFA